MKKVKLSAEKIINHYKTDLNITNKDRIIEDLNAQSLYILDFSERRERYIDRLEKKLNAKKRSN
tara:strand:- start:170 stop:361 length:192 start_codon:yes stop_codon:yes gene_type:complete